MTTVAPAGAPPAASDLGRRRNPILTADYHRGRRPPNFGKRYPAETLTADEQEALLLAFGGGCRGARARALVAVMLRSGLRVDETTALALRDLDFELGAITVRHGKGDQRRLAPMDRHTAQLIRAWLRHRERLGAPPGAPLFCTYEHGLVGQAVRAAWIRDTLKKAARRAGIEKRVHPHGLRHTFAFELLREGYNLRSIQLALGHNDLGTTERYLRRLGPLQMLDELRERAWAGREPDPVVTAAARSHGHPAPTTAAFVAPESDAQRPLPAADLSTRGQRGATKQQILELVRRAGGRASQAQLARALRMRSWMISVHCRDLARAGLLVRCGQVGRQVDAGASSVLWALPAAKATYSPYTKLGASARSGHGAERVLEALADAGGRASQAQLAGLLGLDPRTVGQHCRLLEARGQLVRGGLDKSTSNRGSQVWNLPERHRFKHPGELRTLRLAASSSSTRATA